MGTAISAISYTASASATFTKTGSTFPSGLTVSNSGSSYTIYGTPAATGTYGYSLTASVNGCSSAAPGTITVASVITISTTGGPNTAYTNTTWITGTGSSAQTWSDRIVLDDVCTKTNTFTYNYTTAEYKISDGRYYYSWTCVYDNQTTLCPSGWRVPSSNDISTLISNLGGNTESTAKALSDAWGYGGLTGGGDMLNADAAYYWSVSRRDDASAFYLNYMPGWLGETWVYLYNGLQVRCVK
jgi:uncharacterized protein (TIGR02145 family)